MTRIKRGTLALKRRRNVLTRTKGFRFGRKSKERMARTAIAKAGAHAFDHRKDKKGDMRRLWTIRLNAALRPLGMNYSTFINVLKKKESILDRKVLSQIAQKSPESFSRLVSQLQ
jgi:large subunit ribosomal protein L20